MAAPVTADHQEVTGEHEDDGDEKGGPFADANQRQDKNQQQRDRASEDHAQSVVHVGKPSSGAFRGD
jgi:hypothetical protein